MPRPRPTAGRPAGRPAHPRVAGSRRRPETYRAEGGPAAHTAVEPGGQPPAVPDTPPAAPPDDAAAPEAGAPEAGAADVDAAPATTTPAAARKPSPGPLPWPRRTAAAGGAATTDGAATDGTATDRAAASASAAAPAGRRITRLWAVAAGLLLVATVLAVLTLGWLGSYRDARARADAWQQALPAAKEKVAQLFSYDYRHIREDRDRVSGLLTGQFRTDYLASMDKLVVPQAPAKKFVLVSTTQSAGVSSVTADGTQAVVIMFLNQAVTNTDVASRTDLVRLRVTMTRVNGAWLISAVQSV